ncbi:nuclear transport factor 2 family protein [Streptomyces sp. NPDC026672]|uniref:ester cyclase n=1 Tax=unclassified Streptomyces TaxID=2593676 RepID=UPI0033E55014
MNDRAGAWLALWNGDHGVADKLIDPDITVHAPTPDGGVISGTDGLPAYIGQIRGPLPDLAFTVEVGPVAQDDHLAVRWRATGTYAGGFPGAAAPVGTGRCADRRAPTGALTAGRRRAGRDRRGPGPPPARSRPAGRGHGRCHRCCARP